MRYPEPTARSAEHLRRAVARMAQHPAAFHPLTYAVWYDYVSGANAPLNQAVDAHPGPMDDEAIRRLFADHVADTDAATLDRLGGAVRRMADEVAASAQRTGAQASLFQRQLHTVNHALADRASRAGSGEAGLQALLSRTAEDAQSLAESVDALTGRLDQSRQEVAALREQLQRAHEAVLTDALTGLYSRQAMRAALTEREHVEPDASCVLLIDIDRFARVNDAFGNLFGDRVLAALGRLLRDAVPPPGLAARWDGEEFAVLLPGQTLGAATALAERLLDAVERIRIRRKGFVEPVGQISVSIGIAQRQAAESGDALLARAHGALLRSKADGRNRLTVAV